MNKRIWGLIASAAWIGSVVAAVPADYAKAVRFTVAGMGASTATDLPVLVRISESISGFSYADLRADGRDLLFTDARGNVLPHELELWNPGGESLVWVKVPSVSQNTAIMCFFGGAPSDDTTHEVWSDYIGVWHLDEDGGTATNSVSTALNAEPAGHTEDMARYADGMIGPARVNSTKTGTGNAAGLLVPSYAMGERFTISGWFNVSAGNGSQRFFSHKQTYTETTGFEIGLSGGAAVQLSIRGSSDAGYKPSVLPGNGFMNTWLHLTVSFSETTVSVYTNGGFYASGTIAKVKDNDYSLAIGTDSDVNEVSLCGRYDEVRLSGLLSADQIAASYKAMSASFLTPGTVEEVAGKLPSFTEDTALVWNGQKFELSGALGNVAAEVSYSLNGGASVVIGSLAANEEFSVELDGLTPDVPYTCEVLAVSAGGYCAAKTFRFNTTSVTVERVADAQEEGLIDGSFRLSIAAAQDADLTVAYQVGGTATPGVDYEALSGMATIPAGSTAVTIPVVPIYSETASNVIVTVELQGVASPSGAASASLTVVNRERKILPTKFRYRVTLTVDGLPDGVKLRNLPVLVRLSTAIRKFDYGGFKSADYSDFVFVDDYGSELPCEVDVMDPTGESCIWVKLPVAMKDMRFYLFYGTKSLPARQLDPALTWTNYGAVWHLNETSDVARVALSESTGNLSSATNNGSLAVSGIIGGGRRVYDGSTPRSIDLATGDELIELGSQFTCSMWLRHNRVGSSTSRIIARKRYIYGDGGWVMASHAGDTTVGYFFGAGTGNEMTIWNAFERSVTNQWSHSVVVWNNEDVTAYFNGLRRGTGTLKAGATNDNGGKIVLGRDGLDDFELSKFDFDEVRFRRGTTTPEYIAAEYATVADPEFLSAKVKDLYCGIVIMFR